MEVNSLEIWIVAAPLGGGAWVYTDKKEAEESYDAAIQMNVNSYKELGKKVKVIKSETLSYITDANDGHIMQTILLCQPMNGQGISIYTDKKISMKTFHTSYGAAVSIKEA